MTTKIQLPIADIEFVVGSVAKRSMYKVAVLAVLLLTVILMVIGFISLI